MMLSMKAQVEVVCCKSVGTDLSMLDIEDFITEICRLKKEVASLETKLRERGDKLNREDVEQVSVRVTDGTEAQDSVWSVRDQRSRDTQDSELSLTLLCYTDAQDHESTDQTSDCNAGEQQMLQTPLKMCSVKLVDCRNLIESRGEETTAEKEQQHTEEQEDDENGDDEDEDHNNVDDGDFVPLEADPGG
ncbi:nucleolin-like isoform X2 [Cyprinus carpio]|uniref:Nucleolin-like isoform X2 n=1 Tax=Cyprinus carpio TaxID=7962 RepID=A0A9Q9ZTP1_CYPCA|nr:nucleolin-like isoform X2 [Cyprinus carpio]